MTKEHDLRADMVDAMMNLEAPTTLYKIMKTTGLPSGTVDYWLDKLEEEGVVVSDITNGQKGYVLQPIFYSPEFARTLDSELNNLYELVAKKLILPKGKNKERCTFATLLSILHVIAKKHRI